MHSHKIWGWVSEGIFVVLILVLMEDALARVEVEAIQHEGKVLILVLMEDALAHKKNRVEDPKSRKVLILVLMEDALALFHHYGGVKVGQLS